MAEHRSIWQASASKQAQLVSLQREVLHHLANGCRMLIHRPERRQDPGVRQALDGRLLALEREEERLKEELAWLAEPEPPPDEVALRLASVRRQIAESEESSRRCEAEAECGRGQRAFDRAWQDMLVAETVRVRNEERRVNDEVRWLEGGRRPLRPPAQERRGVIADRWP